MPRRYDVARLATAANLHPESDGIVEKGEEWWIGMIAIPKSTRPSPSGARPTYRRGWTYALEPDMRFVAIPFARGDGAAAIGVVLRGSAEDFFAGWFGAERAGDVIAAVDQLNGELDAERSRFGSGEPAGEILFEIGNEHAPDNPFGRERVRLSPTGAIHYEQIRRDGLRVADGRVAPSPWASFVEALSAAGFPASPQKGIRPGAGPVRLRSSGIIVGDVLLDPRDALKMDGYRVVVGTLMDLCEALRTADSQRLASLGYVSNVAE